MSVTPSGCAPARLVTHSLVSSLGLEFSGRLCAGGHGEKSCTGLARAPENASGLGTSLSCPLILHSLKMQDSVWACLV